MVEWYETTSFVLPNVVFIAVTAVAVAVVDAVPAAAELGCVGHPDRLLGDDQAHPRGHPALHAAVQRARPSRGTLCN